MTISRKILANAIRILSMDIVENANSGHPGGPMGMSDVAEILWRNFMKFNPKNPNWINRDRFIMSNGHYSALLYSILHLTGYNISISDLKSFRKINSKTPGHPEYKHTEGVEVTTGPLGQGLANAVGIAIGEKILSAQFNKENYSIIDHYTYVFVGEGCLMEGISHEACSLAGNLELNKLIVLYDNNNISIDGNIKDWFIDNTEMRFKSYNWNVINNIDAYNYIDISEAINKAKISNKPSLLIFKTVIAFGSPNKAGNYITHGTPLGKDESNNTRKNLKWIYEPFYIPKEIYKEWNMTELGKKYENLWNKKFNKYKLIYPKLFKELNRRINKELPNNWNIYFKNILNILKKNKNSISTRQASQNILNIISNKFPELLGGSADLTSSVLTNHNKSISIKKHKYGNYIHYGVREFAMTAIGNGIAVYKGFIPYNGTFLVFMDYAKNAVRMASLMGLQQILIYTHDSVWLGEDGPTHQPIEQLLCLRSIPNLYTWRPCDEIETAFAWKFAIENKNSPTAIVLSRQKLDFCDRTDNIINNISKGGYIIKESSNNLDLIIISSGSEIKLSIEIYTVLIKSGYNVRIVSMPSTSIFDLQPLSYRRNVLPSNIKKVVIEASLSDFWYKYINHKDIVFGINQFGKSGNINDLYNFFEFTSDIIISKIIKFLKN